MDRSNTPQRFCAPNREAWLRSVVEELRPAFFEAGHRIPERLRVSCGFPSSARLGRPWDHASESWSADVSQDGTYEIFISPEANDLAYVVGLLARELIRICTPGSRTIGRRQLVAAIGLLGSLQRITIHEKLVRRIDDIRVKLGPYPHGRIDVNRRPKVGNSRMTYLICHSCGAPASMPTYRFKLGGLKCMRCDVVMELRPPRRRRPGW